MTSASRDFPHYSISDYAQWEGDWELLQGVAIAMSPSADITHQRVSARIHRQLDEQLDHCPKCLALYEIDWIVAEDTVVRPDNIVICYEPEGKYLDKAPELIVEILSESTARIDETHKFQLYEKEGVKYYVLVYPNLKVCKIYELEAGKFIKLQDASHDRVDFSVGVGECSIVLDTFSLW